MTNIPIEAELRALYRAWKGEEAEKIIALPASGSARIYFRLEGTRESIIGAFNPDVNENEAFFYLCHHFLSKGLNVPQVLHIADDRKAYLLEDLGDLTFFSWMQQHPDREDRRTYYEQILLDLIRFQTDGAQGLDFSRCYPLAEFDSEAIHWDLNYFKYYFLKLAGIPFDEFRLQQGLNDFARNLSAQDRNFFMYRDFQSRNIMVSGEKLYYIDFQGGRKGPLTYDPASLLYNTRANLSVEERKEYLDFYYTHLPPAFKPEWDAFQHAYDMMALARVLQALGASGYRGYFERKPYFLRSLPYGLRNLKLLLEEGRLALDPYLREILASLPDNEHLKEVSGTILNLRVHSFSYKNGLPADPSGNGGGFVFDCRALPNPGREPAFREMSGRDAPVIDYLNQQAETSRFLEHTTSLVQQSVDTYLARNFENLSVSFGCTGGQHRSVYCAEKLAESFRYYPGVKVLLRHLQLDGPH